MAVYERNGAAPCGVPLAREPGRDVSSSAEGCWAASARLSVAVATQLREKPARARAAWPR